jgi:catechol-2,3-dioxygenase
MVITIREAAVKIAKIDHIHVYVENIELAERWYQEVLGFSRDDSLYFWFEQGGPLVLKNHGASLSLFPRKNQHPGHTVAFAVEADAFLSFVPALNAEGIPFTVCDHDVSMSVYFNDLSDNKIELTSYEYLQAKKLLEIVV